MKTLKRISALLLAVLLMASFSITAFAEEEEDLTVKEPVVVSGSGTEATVSVGGITETSDADDGHVVGYHQVIKDPNTGVVTVNADISTSGSDALTASNRSTVNVNGDVSGDNSYLVVNADNSTVNIAGNVTGNYNVLGIEAQNGSTVTVGTVDEQGNVSGGNVTSDGNEAVKADYGSTVIVHGYVAATENDGIFVVDTYDKFDPDGSNTTVNVSGSVTAVRDGIIADCVTKGIVVTAETGDINSGEYGIEAYAGHTYYGENVGGTVNIKVGDIDSKAKDGIIAKSSNGGAININAGNVISAGDNGINVVATDMGGKAGSTTNISVENLTASGTGINVYTGVENDIVNITVGTVDYGASDGTVTGGVNLENATAGDVHITAWKITGDLNGSACDAAINYIIRTAQNDITAQNDKEENITTAQINDKIYIKPIDGFEVVSAKNNDDPLYSDDEGFFYQITQHGGGIMLSAVLQEIKPTPPPGPDPIDPDPDPDPKPDPKPTPVFAAATYKLKFDLDGGVMPDGKTELEMKCSAGQHIKLPEAPTREGFTFAGWQTEIRGNTVILDAGAKFTVTAAKTFVALWEEA